MRRSLCLGLPCIWRFSQAIFSLGTFFALKTVSEADYELHLGNATGRGICGNLKLKLNFTKLGSFKA
jgi:hypothetical protein